MLFIVLDLVNMIGVICMIFWFGVVVRFVFIDWLVIFIILFLGIEDNFVVMI